MAMPKPEKIDMEFTDARLTGMAGSLFIAQLANQLKLPKPPGDGCHRPA